MHHLFHSKVQNVVNIPSVTAYLCSYKWPLKQDHADISLTSLHFIRSTFCTKHYLKCFGMRGILCHMLRLFHLKKSVFLKTSKLFNVSGNF